VTKIPLFSDRGDVIGLAGLMRDVHRAGAVLRPYEAMTPVLQYITENYRDSISLGDLAAVAGMSVRRLERRFKALFHVTPLAYINLYRVRKACVLLRNTDDAITNIALAVDFYDSSHFVRQFRRFMGMTPTEYRHHCFG